MFKELKGYEQMPEWGLWKHSHKKTHTQEGTRIIIKTIKDMTMEFNEEIEFLKKPRN